MSKFSHQNPFLFSIIIIIIIFPTLINATLTSNNKRELKYVHAIWRHGDRAPKRKPYEDDIYGVFLIKNFLMVFWSIYSSLD